MKRILLSLALLLTTFGTVHAQDLTVWTTFEDRSMDWLREQAASFTSGSGVGVELVPLDAAEIKQRALLGASDGQAGDLFVGVPHDQVGDLVVGGILADMTGYATSDYLADLSDQARLGFTFGSKLFGLPMFVEGPALIVNTDLVEDPPRTYQDLVRKASSLSSAETFGFMSDISNFYFAYGWLHTFGGYVFGRDDGTLDPSDIGLANEGAIRGARALKDLRFTSRLVPAGTTFDVANGLFAEGALAMIYIGPWTLRQYRQAGRNVAVVAMPPLADGTPWSGFMIVHGVLVNRFSPAKNEAANFAKWLTRKDALVSLAREADRIPASASALAALQDEPVLVGFGAALADAEPIPNIPAMGQVWGPMARALRAITGSPESDVEQILKQAVAEIDAP